MKFGKKLQHQLDHSLPEWKPNFLCYKQLKKRLKHLGKSAPMTFLTAAIMAGTRPSEDGHSFLIREVGQKRKSEQVFHFEQHKKTKGDEVGSLTEDFPETQDSNDRLVQEQCVLILKQNDGTGDFPQVQETRGSSGEEQEQSPKRLTENDEKFLQLVKTELHKFNAFFLEKEEEFLIRLSLLEKKADDLKEKRVLNGGACDLSTQDELIDVQRQIVTLHGEMVLLMNYSSLNYVGLLKILKKYDKHTKSTLRQLVHASVLQQPFFSIATLKGMVARSLACEDSLWSIG